MSKSLAAPSPVLYDGVTTLFLGDVTESRQSDTGIFTFVISPDPEQVSH